MKRQIKKCSISFMILCALLISMVFGGAPFAMADSSDLYVYTGQVVQDNFLGANAIYHAYAFRSDSDGREYTNAQRKTEFDRIGNMEMQIVRTYYDVDYAWYNNKWDWESPNMLALYDWLQAMKDRGVDVALNAAWSCPASIDSSTGWPLPRSPLTAPDDDWGKSVENYADWITESLRQMIVVHGFTNVKYLVMFTEPQRASVNTKPDGSKAYDKYLDCVKAAHESLIDAGLRDKILMVGPNEGSTYTSEMVEWVVKNANQYIDIYSSHNYEREGTLFDTYDDWYEWVTTGMDKAKSTGKPFWFDEYGTFNESMRLTDPWYGTILATAQTAFMNAGAQTSLLWTLFDQQWPNNHSTNNDSFYDGVHKHGIAPTLLESEVPRKSYYAFSMISKYMGGEGTKVFKTENNSGINISASQLPSGDWSVLVVNSNQDDASFTVNFDQDMQKDFYRHIYDPAIQTATAAARMIGADKTFSRVGRSLSDTLPAGGVAIYTSRADFDKNIPQILEYSTDRVGIKDGAVNAITQGGFENTPPSGQSWNTDDFIGADVVSLTSEDGLSGEKALKYQGTGSAVMVFPVKKHTQYMFSTGVKGSYLSPDNAGDMTFGVANPATGKYITFINDMLAQYEDQHINCTETHSMAPPAWDNQWHRRGCTFNTGELTSIAITITGKDSTAFFDDMILCELSDAVPLKAARKGAVVTDEDPALKGSLSANNLVPNANFSESDLSFWNSGTLYGKFVSVSSDPAKPSQKVLLYDGTEGITGKTYMRWFNVKSDTEYTFTVLSRGIEDGGVQFGIMDDNEELPQNIGKVMGINEDENWQVHSLSFNSGDCSKIGFYLSDTGGKAAFTNLMLFESKFGIKLEDSDYPMPVNPKTGISPVAWVILPFFVSGAGVIGAIGLKKRKKRVLN